MYYYFDFNDLEKQKASSFLSSVVAQLCSQSTRLLDGAQDIYHKCHDGHQKPTLKDLQAALDRILKGFGKVFLVMDALDECSMEDNEREQLLKIINNIHVSSSQSLHLLATSRRESDIEAVLVPMLTIPAISIQSARVDADIKIHVRSELGALGKRKNWPHDLLTEIEETLVREANGM